MNLNMLCDDWGWFIDVENNNCSENILLQPCRSPVKKFNSHLHRLPTIEEDEYDYYKKMYRDPEHKIYKEVEEKYDINLKSSNKNRENKNILFNVGSTTLITAVLRYVIFVILYCSFEIIIQNTS
jgi:hypothetical protein